MSRWHKLVGLALAFGVQTWGMAETPEMSQDILQAQSRNNEDWIGFARSNSSFVKTDRKGNNLVLSLHDDGSPQNGGKGIIISKIDGQGKTIWRRDNVRAEFSEWQAADLALDRDDGAVVLAYSSSGGAVIKFNAQGRLLWVRRSSELENVGIQFTAMDVNASAGTIAVVGRLWRNSVGDYSPALISLSKGGSVRWERVQSEVVGFGSRPVAAHDQWGNIYVGFHSFRVSKFGANGTLHWTSLPEHFGRSQITDMKVDESGRVAITGYGADHGSEQLSEGLIPLNEFSAFLMVLQKNGGRLHARLERNESYSSRLLYCTVNFTSSDLIWEGNEHMVKIDVEGNEVWNVEHLPTRTTALHQTFVQDEKIVQIGSSRNHNHQITLKYRVVDALSGQVLQSAEQLAPVKNELSLVVTRFHPTSDQVNFVMNRTAEISPRRLVHYYTQVTSSLNSDGTITSMLFTAN